MLAAIDPYATGVLKEDTHGRLVADIDNIARDASIQREWIWTPLADVVSNEEFSYVRSFRSRHMEGVAGLCLVGTKGGAENRMSAIAGALVRNFIRARVFTASQLLDMAEERAIPEATCLLIPNFFVGKAMGATIPTWKITALLDILTERQLSGQQTVIHVTDMKAMAVEYGSAFAQLINSHYTMADL